MMKATKLFYSALATCLLCGIISSCSDDSAIPVKRIEAFIDFDLSSRANWELRMEGYTYDFEVVGNKLSAVPKDKPYYFDAGQTTTNGDTRITLCSPSYRTRMALSEVGPPTEADQSTPEKLASYDMLIGRYIGDIKEELKDVRLTHYDPLLNFKVCELPQGAEVFIIQNKYLTITPLRDEENKEAYKAIVWAGNTNESTALVVKTASKTYNKVFGVPLRPDNNGFVLNFTARINAEDELVIENRSIDEWAGEWPLNQ